MSKVVIPLFNAQNLGEKVAKELKAEVIKHETRKFPDKEIYFRIDGNVKGKEVVLVQSGYPGPNHALMELLFACDACRDMSAKEIIVVAPYLPYARQDKRFKDGEAHSLKTVAKILKSLGVSKLITADAHYRDDYGEKDLFGLKNVNISAGKLLVEHLKKKFGVEGMHVISPDLGASGMVKNAASAEGVEYSELKKVRKGDFDVEMFGEMDVKGKNVLVLDDIISTGGTMLLAIDKSRKAGAKKVFAAATHGIFGWDALDKLNQTADYLVTTDSIPNPTSFVSLAEEIAKVL
ncbi:MAG: ribose-phosphate diphosphokinase [archaeon]